MKEGVDPLSIAAKFGVEAASAKRAPRSNLSSVYILDDAYVLRSRDAAPSLGEALERERLLLAALGALVPVSFPVLMNTRDGKKFVEIEGKAWTLYPLIRGDVLCGWQELYYAIKEEEWEAVLSFMRQMHDATRGKLPAQTSPYSFARDVGGQLDRVGKMISEHAQKRMRRALDIVAVYEAEHTQSFVHGDLHPGNMLFSGGKVVGLIDVDWCRAGVWAEDLGYLAMMALRDYRKNVFLNLDKEFFARILDWYGVPESERATLYEYIVLYTFYDFALFEWSPQMPKQALNIGYQRGMVEKLCSVL